MDAVEYQETDADRERDAVKPDAPPEDMDSAGDEAGEVETSEAGPAPEQEAEPPPAEPPAAHGVGEAIEPLRAEMAEGFAGLLRAFEGKLAYDRTKEVQIDRLHGELQEHKQDLVAKIKRPLVQGIVRLHDDLGKVVAALHRRPAESLTPDRFFRAFAGFTDDVELLLGQHGIETFLAPGDAFDPRRQTALRTEATDDPDLAGTVAVRLRPGFVEGEAMLQKERVAVYAAVPKPSSPPAHAAVDPSPPPTEQRESSD